MSRDNLLLALIVFTPHGCTCKHAYDRNPTSVGSYPFRKIIANSAGTYKSTRAYSHKITTCRNNCLRHEIAIRRNEDVERRPDRPVSVELFSCYLLSGDNCTGFYRRSHCCLFHRASAIDVVSIVWPIKAC